MQEVAILNIVKSVLCSNKFENSMLEVRCSLNLPFEISLAPDFETATMVTAGG